MTVGWGFLDDIGDAFEEVGEGISDVAESAYDAVSQGAVGDAIGWAGRTVDTATFGLASTTMNAADDYVFDTVDYVTGGAVNVDFDDGQFTVGAGIDGLAHVGASIGEDGIGASSEALYNGFDVSMTHDGFSASGSAGIDWGPLPYAEGHVTLAANGDVLVNGRAQGTLPTPYGIFSGEGEVGFASTDAGWGGYLNSQGSWITPTGVTLAGGEHFAYQQTADGASQLSVGVDGSVGYAGLTVGGGVDYARAESADGDVVQSVGVDGSVSYMGMKASGSVEYDRAESADGDVVEGVQLQGDVDALGMSVRGEATYAHADVDGVERSDWSGDADFDGPSLEEAAHVVAAVARSEIGGDQGADAIGADDVLGSTDLGAADLAPMDDFGSALQAADTVEQSMDDLSQDLTQDLA